MSKRSGEESQDDSMHSAKRSRGDYESSETALVSVSNTSSALVAAPGLTASTALIVKEGARTSTLTAPEITLTGHEAAVYTLAFDPTGEHLATSGMDKHIFLWDVFGDNQNYNVLTGHKNAVLELKWKADNTLLTCSADKTVALWDANRALRLRRFTEHTAIVNSCSISMGDMNLAASGSDDCTAIVWDSRTKDSVMTAYHDYQVCAVQLSHDGQFLYTAGVDSIVRRFDLRVGVDKADLQLDGHSEIITGLALSPDGSSLLSNSMDCTLRLYDVRAYTNQRHRATLMGGHHGAEKLLLRCAWSSDGEYVTAGSADRLVHMWETSRYTEICAWGGHKASVNEVAFHPSQPVLASASSDKTVVLGEFLPQ